MKLQDPNYSLCVPTALCNILSIYGDVSIKELRKALRTHKVWGTPLTYIPEVIGRYGFRLSRLQFNYDGIRAALAHGPVVATYRINDNETHFTRVVGVDRRRKIEYVQLEDPLYGEIEFPLETFKLLWKLDQSWARVMVDT